MAAKKPAKPKDAAPPAKKPRRDVRPLIYGGLDVAFAILQFVVIAFAAPNRHAWAEALLLLLPVGTFAMGAGTLAGALIAKAARPGWIAAIAGGALVLIVTVIVLGLLVASAAFLAGVYGAFGKAAASGMLAAAALIVEFVALLPAFQLKYLLGRAGRRAFGVERRA